MPVASGRAATRIARPFLELAARWLGTCGLSAAFLLALPGCERSRTPPPYVAKAFALRLEIEAANRHDLAWLAEQVGNALSALREPQCEEFRHALRSRLIADKATYRKIASVVATSDLPYLYELRSSLSKLAGAERNGVILRAGILDEALRLTGESFATSVFARPVAVDEARRNHITVLKTLLVYAHVLLSRDSNLTRLVADHGFTRCVQLLYPAKLDLGREGNALLAQALLTSATPDGIPTLHIPNAGYVFGGNFLADEPRCRGIDCSAFVSWALGSRVRMSTLYMELLWRDLRGEAHAFTPREERIRRGFIEEWSFAESRADFLALDPASHNLQAGDVIIWRSRDGTTGHAAIFLQPIAGLPRDFVGITAIRNDDKSMEGVEVGVFALAPPASRTFVLRPRKSS